MKKTKTVHHSYRKLRTKLVHVALILAIVIDLAWHSGEAKLADWTFVLLAVLVEMND